MRLCMGLDGMVEGQSIRRGNFPIASVGRTDSCFSSFSN